MSRVLLCVVLLAAGCAQPELENQRKLETFEAMPGWPRQQAAQWPPSGTVPIDAADAASELPLPVTHAMLSRGRHQFEAFCTPCHDRTGSGHGMVVRHGFPPPPSFHGARLRSVPLHHFYDVMTGGFGLMASYADRVTPDDRWRIAAYLRALQLSQHTAIADVAPEQRRQLEAEQSP